METTLIKVIVIKSKYSKVLIGFSSDPEKFVNNWISNRPQYFELTKVTDTHYTVQLDDNSKLNHFYITSLRDGETCFVSLDNNLYGFQ